MGNGNTDPRKTLFRQLRKRLGEIPGGTARAVYSPLIACCFSQYPCSRGDREWATGHPITPVRMVFFDGVMSS
jgi:hypothetical protein